MAGASGGSAEAVVDGETGLVVADPDDVEAVREAVGRLVDDGAARARMGGAARRRAVDAFSYDQLAERLAAAIESVGEHR